MASLERTLRRQLENTVKQARRVAEAGTRKAIEQLAVHEAKAWSSLTEAQKRLRNRLRAHGRQLGDQRDEKRGTQTINQLVGECAYEHWHRMLFARFLAENNLLIEPETGVAITLTECQELARDKNQDWLEYASGLAVDMLPQIFRSDDPVLQVNLPVKTRSDLEDLLKALPSDIFLADDSLGWVYQFWQAEQKDAVNKSGEKIGADELPAVTQLFTEDYMVEFLLHNTLGAWWAGKVLAENPDLATNAKNEDELRAACAVGDVKWTYLRFVRTSPLNPLSINREGTSDTFPSPIMKRGPESEGSSPLAINGEGGKGGEVRSPVISRNYIAPEKLEAARAFRKSPTAKESEVWEWLRDRRMLGLKFRRQQVIEGFIADFYCAEHRIALELDGEVHNTEEAYAYDQARDAIFASKEIQVLRVKNNESTREHLEQLLKNATSPLNPLSINGEGTLQDTRNNASSPSPDMEGRPGGQVPSPLATHEEAGKKDKVSSPSPDMERGPGGEVWRPAAGTFEGWPRFAKDITMLDPCMGSGHFLVFALLIFVAIRMAEEGLTEKDAVLAVLRENLFGLEIDQRCTQIAAFNLALAAWRRTGYCPLPALNLACSGLAIGVSKSEWLELADELADVSPVPPERDLLGSEENLFSNRIKSGLETLYNLFSKAPILGSLINPRQAGSDLLEAGYDELESLLSVLFSKEKDESVAEMAVTAHGLAKAAEILAGQYTLVATNVPYLGRGKQDDVLQDYCDRVYPDAKADLATCFIERCFGYCAAGGNAALVAPQNWLFLASYKKFRERLLHGVFWSMVARLGEGAFDSPQAAGAFTAMLTLTNRKPSHDSSFAGQSVADEKTPDSKAEALRSGSLAVLTQLEQLKNPDAIVTVESLRRGTRLQEYATAYEGAKTVDIERFRHFFWELSAVSTNNWWFHNSSPTGDALLTGCHYISANRSPGSKFAKNIQTYEENGQKVVAWLCGKPCWENRGVAVAWMRDLPASLYIGTVFDNSAAVILPLKEEYLPAIYTFVTSGEYSREMRKLNQKVQVAAGTLDKVPFDLAQWQKVAAEKYPHGLPKPFSSDPTQWLFNGHPQVSDQPLQIAVARLLGYQWPRQTGSSFPDCPALGLDGLESFADDDGIVCLHPVNREQPAATRLRTLLATAFSDAWSASKERELLAAAGMKKESLEDWLSDGFFEQHCASFHQRPFIWHIWDGRQDGFNALVNYHRLSAPNGEGHRLLEKMIYTYLGDWITRQRQDQQQGVEGADARLAAALHLQNELKRILEGEPPYDIFVRWKPLHEQAIGWDPDINDGIRMNIRPFMAARPLNAKAKNACILRIMPKIKWNKDRGKEPERPKENFPWFWGWDEKTQDFTGGKTFDGNRWNDLHYKNESKQSARERKEHNP